MPIVNLTSHEVIIGDRTFEPSGKVARVAVETHKVMVLDGIEIRTPVFGKIVDLPKPCPGTIFIVSALVKNAAQRPDVVSPGGFVRDESGRIIGASWLETV